MPVVAGGVPHAVPGGSSFTADVFAAPTPASLEALPNTPSPPPPPRRLPPPPTITEKIEQWRQKYAPNEPPWQPPGFNQPPKPKPVWLLKAQREIINADRSLHRNTNPPSAPSTDPALERMRRVNSDIGTVHRIMNEPGPSWEPQSSLGNEPWRFPRR
jgi:hypothetical protein